MEKISAWSIFQFVNRSMLLVVTVLFVGASCGTFLNLEMEEEIDPPVLLANIVRSTRLAEGYKGREGEGEEEEEEAHPGRSRFVLLSRSAAPDRKSSGVSIRSGNPYFSLGNETSSDIFLTKKIDRERVCEAEVDRCVLHLQVAVFPLYLGVINVHVTILDVNDNPPKFAAKSPYVIEISEDSPPGSKFLLPAAFDPDSRMFGIKRYQIRHPQLSKIPFTLHYNNNNNNKNNNNDDGDGDDGNAKHQPPRLMLTRPLDRETEDHYEFQMEVQDGGQPALSDSVRLRISVLDENDNAPHFRRNFIRLRIFENVTAGSVVAVVAAEDADSGANGRVSYFLETSPDALLFHVDSESGELSVTGPLDRETRDRHEFKVVARDDGDRIVMTSTCDVVVDVVDVNDNAPLVALASTSTRLEVAENRPPGEFVAFVSVEDPDEGPGGRWSCRLTGADSRSFAFESLGDTGDTGGQQYKLLTSTTFDREAKEVAVAMVTCSDEGSPSLTGSREIEVAVTDVNDNEPRMSEDVYYFEFEENNRPGFEIGRLDGYDFDEGANGLISYRLLAGRTGFDPHSAFSLDRDTGRLCATVTLDREFKQTYEFKVVAEDSGSPTLSSTSVVRIKLLDVDDEAPTFSSSLFTFGTYENQPPGVEIGQVAAHDLDSPPFNRVRYDIDHFRDVFSVDELSGKLTALVSLDREAVPSYSFQVLAWNDHSVRPTSSTSVSVVVADRNDNAPTIHFPVVGSNDTVQVSNRTPVGRQVTLIVATDADVGSNANLRYFVAKSALHLPGFSTSGSSPLFDVDPWSGIVRVTSDLTSISDRLEVLNVVVHDEGSPKMSSTCWLKIVVNSSLGNNSPVYLPSSSSSSSESFPSAEESTAKPPHSLFSLLIDFPISLVVLVSAMVGTLVVFLMAVVAFVVCYNRRQRGKHSRIHRPLCRPPDLMYIPKFAIKKAQAVQSNTPPGGFDRGAHLRTLPGGSRGKDLTFHKEKYFLTSKKFKNKKVVCDRDFFYYANNSFAPAKAEKPSASKQRNRLSLPAGQSFVIHDVPSSSCQSKNAISEEEQRRNRLKTFSQQDACCWKHSDKSVQQQIQGSADRHRESEPKTDRHHQPSQPPQPSHHHHHHHPDHHLHNHQQQCQHHQQQQQQLQQQRQEHSDNMTNSCEGNNNHVLEDSGHHSCSHVARKNSKHKCINTSQISYSSSSNDTHTSVVTRSTSVNSSREDCCNDGHEEEDEADERPTTFTLAIRLKPPEHSTTSRWLNYVSVDPPSEC